MKNYSIIGKNIPPSKMFMTINNSKNELDKKIILVKVKKNDCHAQILFDLLEKRTVTISHNVQPSYTQHKDFVINNPYRVWFLVKQNEEFIGSVYILKNNTIGINMVGDVKATLPIIINQLLDKYKPLRAIKSIRSGFFDINVSPNNIEYIKILEEMGAQLVQFTYTLPSTIFSNDEI